MPLFFPATKSSVSSMAFFKLADFLLVPNVSRNSKYGLQSGSKIHAKSWVPKNSTQCMVFFITGRFIPSGGKVIFPGHAENPFILAHTGSPTRNVYSFAILYGYSSSTADN